MVVDVKIGTVETRLTAASPEILRSPQFMAEVVRLVKEELKREQALDSQRASDRTMARPAPGRSL
ncbi:MAG: hypothetical protein ACOH2J_10600 [Allorhizobium sp.]